MGESEEKERHAQGWVGFAGGVSSGLAKNLIGHPFDTIKVRLQTSKGRFKGPWDCVVQTMKKEGIYGFYRGMTPPLVGWVIMDSVMLGSLHNYRNFLMDTVYKDQEKLPLAGHCIAGLGAGMTVSFVAAVVEQVKARLQVQYDAKTKLYSGPIDCLVKVYKSNGIRGVYRGLGPTMIFRLNFVFWWGLYEIFTNYLQEHTNMSKVAVNFWSGGLSASVFWTVAYPSDVVKQVIMTDNLQNPRFKTWWGTVKYIYATRGMRGFFKGYAPAMLRSFPCNAGALAAFEATLRLLGH